MKRRRSRASAQRSATATERRKAGSKGRRLERVSRIAELKDRRWEMGKMGHMLERHRGVLMDHKLEMESRKGGWRW
jgi:hypothetical protein